MVQVFKDRYMHIFSLSISIPFLSPLPTLKVLPSVSFPVSQPLINYVINWAATITDREHQLGSDPQSGLHVDVQPHPHHFCSPSTVICRPLPSNSNTPQVENPSQYIQGYRVLFRQTSGLPSPGPWQIQDLKVASERDITLADLKKGIVYEIKVRPYFNEFQGADSESMTARTMEEGKASRDSGRVARLGCFHFFGLR